MTQLKVALIQKNAIANNKRENLKLAVNYIEEAARNHADVVLFPEMWSNGYSEPFEGAFDNPRNFDMENERITWLNEGIELGDGYIETLQLCAKTCRIGVCATYLSKQDKTYQNVAIIINKQGEIILDYAKVHTCDFSLEQLFEAGNAFKVCEFEGVQLGVMICYDREFPESARVLMLKGAEIVLVPNACAMNPARLNQLSTRAFENMIGIAMANYPQKQWGCSAAFSPIVFNKDGDFIDNTLCIAPMTEEMIVYVDFDMTSIRKYRCEETWGNAYRKPRAYHDVVSDDVQEPFIRNK